MKRRQKTIEQTISKRLYIDHETGDVQEFAIIKKNVSSDYNFHKVWLTDLLSILDNFGNKKFKILSYLLGHMRSEDNTISTTYRKIQEHTGISLPTITATIKELVKSNVIKKQLSSTYVFNPDLIIKGSSEKRRQLLIEYIYEDSCKQVKEKDKPKIINELSKKLLSRETLENQNAKKIELQIAMIKKYNIPEDEANQILQDYQIDRIEGVMRKIDRLTKIRALKVETTSKRTQYFLECIEKNLTE